ncbi:hypothetical protein ILYODFUR_015540 [Ilyodon furcidens]|uniref:Uncharacterized protein n=1 Tax=Ilyodon furcidens TaxID=33524 RepID=A0ABV0TML9_9TELE
MLFVTLYNTKLYIYIPSLRIHLPSLFSHSPVTAGTPPARPLPHMCSANQHEELPRLALERTPPRHSFTFYHLSSHHSSQQINYREKLRMTNQGVDSQP